ncbi:hypothetical protein HW561_06920 [Rhodobacteraceae bacterium B1Z28]|uniref:ElaB/YqjD/DUF883 family membrane-anchored ribosome-binding protein n=1 Tax=Ruegeria haliotis TaxID=2747601 RepID=A0ABX2PQN1_9RHOB|nr:hypothetical protein [Ruegeria haliotis]NVO55517.1 hypothetical protein [Ruegeria haliotis]
MATKAELEAELKELRTRNAQLEEDADQNLKPDAEAEPTAPRKTTDEIRALLEEHGIDLSKAQAVGEEAVEEFGRLQKDYPITALLVAFSLGYVVGRAQG